MVDNPYYVWGSGRDCWLMVNGLFLMPFHGFATSLQKQVVCCSRSAYENYEESAFYTIIYSGRQVMSGSLAYQEKENAI